VADDHHAEAPPSPGRHNQQPSDQTAALPRPTTGPFVRCGATCGCPKLLDTHTAGTTRLNLGSLLAERFDRDGGSARPPDDGRRVISDQGSSRQPAGHIGDARCNGSAPANYSAVMSDTVRGDVHELTLRLSPNSPAGSRRPACDCTTVVRPFGRRDGAPATASKVTNRQHPGSSSPWCAGSAPPAPAVLPVDISGALARACPKREFRA